MNILFDGRVFQFQKAGGINRYFAEIIKRLPLDWKPIITGVQDFGKNIPKHPRLTIKNPVRFRPRRFQFALEKAWWRPTISKQIQLLHPTYFDLTCGFKLSDFNCPMVTTVHDLIYARFPSQMGDSAALVKAMRESVIRADTVICISKSTERDLLEFIPEAKGKVEIIYHGSSFPITEGGSETELFERPTFLYVGYREGYKNFQLLLRAFAKAASLSPKIHLHVVGPPFSHEERWQIYFLGLSDRVTSSVFLDEDSLKKLYQECVALLYPSRYEGFGIPPLEAMASGTIAVTSNTTSLPEVVGEGGIMLDPADEDAWTECILKLSRPFSGRSQLLKQAKAQAQRFNWDECSRKHQEIYRKLVSSPD